MAKYYVGQNANSVEVAPGFDEVTGVKVYAGTTTNSDKQTVDVIYSAGTETGTVVEVDCPWGNQAMADRLLDIYTGYKYQPYTIDSAVMDPAYEMGDSVVSTGKKSGMFSIGLTHGREIRANLSAPFDEEVNHEYPYTSGSSTHKAEREIAEVRASLLVELDEISAEVVHHEGGTSSSFAWHLNSDKFTLTSNGTEVFKCNSSGITISGNASVSGNITCNNLTVGSTTFTGTEAESLLNLLDDENDSWSSAYTSACTSGGYSYDGSYAIRSNSSLVETGSSVRNWTGAIQSPYSPTFEGNTGTWTSGSPYGIPYNIFVS